MSREIDIGVWLHDHGLKKTPIRVKILELFLEHDYALSAVDVLALMPKGQDKVTVYRALTSFEEKGLIHRASEDGHGVKYAACNHQCPDELHADAHAHFVCDVCHHTYCLDHVQVPELKTGEDFEVDRIHYTLSGTCKNCLS